MSTEILFNASVSQEENHYSGPVLTNDRVSFTFVNKLGSTDLYVTIKKSPSGKWFQSGGPSIQIDEKIIGSIGLQIDEFLLNDKNP